MSLEQSADARPENPPPRGSGLLALTMSVGAAIATFVITHDLPLSVEVATYVLAVAESIRRE
jgi:hypothetical protein